MLIVFCKILILNLLPILRIVNKKILKNQNYILKIKKILQYILLIQLNKYFYINLRVVY